MTEMDGKKGLYGPRGLRETPAPNAISAAFIAEVRQEMRTQGREIGEIKKDMKDVSKAVTEMAAIMPHLMTKEHCANTRARETQELKDRMDGKREITGVGMTLPELWEKARIAQEATSDPTKSNLHVAVKPQRDFIYWFRFIASLIGILTFIFGATAFVVRTMERQDRQEQILQQLERRIPTDVQHVGRAATVEGD
jgi:hypothetical protein